MHFIGGDEDASSSSGGASGGSSAGSKNTSADLPMPRYRVAIMKNGAKTWLPWMRGKVDEGGSSDTFAGVPGFGIVDVELEEGTLGPKGWFEKNMSGGKLIGITVFYDTPAPSSTGYYETVYRAHWMGTNPSWGKYEHDDDDGGAVNDTDQLDTIELTIEPC